MIKLHENVVRDFLNGIILLCIIVLVALILFIAGMQDAHAGDCYVCGCTTETVEPVTINGNAI